MPKLRVPLRRLALPLAGALAVPLVLAVPAQAVPGSNSTVWINEIHYNNAGTDTGEAVEVAAAAGTNLTGWSVVLYNGNGGAVYDTDALSGTVADAGDGYGFVTLNYSTNGVQNGDPDGVALVNGATVVQFLSYGGTFTAVGGPANGQTSTDIGAAQTGSATSDPVGSSLQLTGIGLQAGHFSWTSTDENTFGAVNAGQAFGTPPESGPEVTSTAPGSNTFGAAPGGDLTVTFSEDVVLSSGAVSLACAGDSVNVTVTGGPSTFTIDPSVDLPVGMTCTAAVDAEGVSDQDTNDPPDAMTADFAWSFVVASTCGDPATVVSTIQGSGTGSPLDGEPVTIQGVVTADRTGGSRLSGFWVEEELADRDSDSLSSEGVFVFGFLPRGVAAGDVVRVNGVVDERFDQTQVSASGVEDCDAMGELPAAAQVEFPVASDSYLERFEGMAVTFTQDLVISEYFNYDRFGEIVVGVPPNGWDRFHTPTAVVEPGPAAQALAAEYELRQITLDDGRGGENRTPAYFPGTVDTPLATTDLFRGGDTLTDVTGVLAWDFGIYRVHPTADATYTSLNPRPEGAPDVGGDITVASFNVLNYFLTLDSGPTADTCAPTQDQDCRGADTAAEFERQKTKIVEALAKLNADVVGLMEMENTPGVEPAADLAAALNERLGAGTYSFIDTGVIGTDAIRVGLLYKAGVVKPLESFHILDSSVDPRFIDTKSRPALAQTFKTIDGDKRFTVAVNHLKSKGSDCEDINDPDTGDGQGNCNLTRTAAAEALADWLASPNIGRGDPDRLIIGDLNSYDHEDPIDALKAAGYTDLIKQFGGEFAYGYVFDGMVGYLDHALANETMASQVTGAAEWHINADEPDILDYDMSFKAAAEEALWEPNEFRSSDHDAVLVGLDLRGHSRR